MNDTTTAHAEHPAAAEPQASEPATGDFAALHTPTQTRAASAGSPAAIAADTDALSPRATEAAQCEADAAAPPIPVAAHRSTAAVPGGAGPGERDWSEPDLGEPSPGARSLAERDLGEGGLAAGDPTETAALSEAGPGASAAAAPAGLAPEADGQSAGASSVAGPHAVRVPDAGGDGAASPDAHDTGADSAAADASQTLPAATLSVGTPAEGTSGGTPAAGTLAGAPPEESVSEATPTGGALPGEPAPEAAPADAGAADSPAAAANGFAELGLSEPVLRAVLEMGYLTPTPIQAQAIPFVLMGRDVLGCAQTGTGKTASFTLPMLDILAGRRARARMPRSLILEPTRELALQVAENFVKYGKYLKLNHALLIGGESLGDQKDALARGVDVLIATPGRLLDLFERGGMLLTDTKLLVIDEADRMLDMGFIPDVEKIVSLLAPTRQTLFFSATMAPEIRRLADAFLNNPKEITVSRPASVASTLTLGLVLVAETQKREALRRLLKSEEVQNALIFCNRKIEVDILYKSLTRHGFDVGALHGDMTQPMRFATLEKFKANELRLLVCSDVAARGLDIGGLSHVFNFDVPHHAEDYVHRIGRTGRAGREGRAFTIATPEDKLAVAAIEKLTGIPIPRLTIEGLEVVEWAEGDGRRRGRGRAKPAGKPERGAARGRGRAGGAAEAAPGRSAPARAEPRPEARAEPRSEARAGGRPDPRQAPRPEARPEGRYESRQEARPEPRPEVRNEPRRDAPRRDGRFRDDDLGPRVLGFGEDVPAFMMIRTRSAAHGRRPAAPEPEWMSEEADGGE